MTSYGPNSDWAKPKSASKADLLVVLLIFAFAGAALITFLF
jgi:hypothetical protein